jgi:hypothetical protein
MAKAVKVRTVSATCVQVRSRELKLKHNVRDRDGKHLLDTAGRWGMRWC